MWEDALVRVLYLTQWFDPEPVYAMNDAAKSLRSLGIDISVLTGFPNWPSGKTYPGYRLKHWQKENIDGVPVIRVPLYPYHGKNGILRALNYLSFTLSAAFLGFFLPQRPDVIFVNYGSVTLGWSAWILSRLWRVPFVLEIQDMWPETLRATGFVGNERIIEAIEKMAKWTYRKSAAIRVISPGFRNALVNKGMSPTKIHVIYNSIDTDHYVPQEPDCELGERLGLVEHFNVIYAGTHGPAQELTTVLEAASLLTRLKFPFPNGVKIL